MAVISRLFNRSSLTCWTNQTPETRKTTASARSMILVLRFVCFIRTLLISLHVRSLVRITVHRSLNESGDISSIHCLSGLGPCSQNHGLKVYRTRLLQFDSSEMYKVKEVLDLLKNLLVRMEREETLWLV